MSKFYDVRAGSAKHSSDSTEHGFDAASLQSTTITSSHVGGVEVYSTKSVRPFTTWHSAVVTTKR